MYADISVVAYQGKDNRQFSYVLMPDQEAAVGSIVEVSFGKKLSLGVVRKLHHQKPRGIKLAKIKEVLPHRPLPTNLLKLADWMIEYYASPGTAVWQMLLPKNSQVKPRKKNNIESTSTKPLIKLNDAQTQVLEKIQSSTQPVLLEGVMGSGKTEIYFHLIRESLGKEKSAIILIPEIFLTEQIIERAKKYFGNYLVITHSGLTPAQRRHAWDRASQEKAVVVIGPRSALFAPVHNLGVLIIDECHEQSYKQDTSPRYLTEHVAAKLAKLSSAQLILGSATPSVTTRYLADKKKLQRVELKQRAIQASHPKIEIVSTQNEDFIFSNKLLQLLEKGLKTQSLSLLYLNRRGTAPIFLCQDCGFSFKCPKCGGGLHFHADHMQLKCHICGFQTPPPGKCPNCQSLNLRAVGLGTKAVESAVKERFPNARVARIDKDNKSVQYNTETLKAINKKEIDVLIGTQMIGRGIDFDNLNMVGIINADYDLSVIDYNSRERAFQLISQTAGRAGRRQTRGEVIIQTKNPGDEFFNYVRQNDYEAFYQSELDLRQQYSYPPFAYLLKLECGFVDPKLGLKKSQHLGALLAKNKKLQLLGPTKAWPEVRGKKHFWQLVVKSTSRSELVQIANKLKPHWKINLDPFGIL